ncbi:MAG: hypothetical protein IJ064_06690 [Bacteroidaceae bacterium]|nr:hypothetical protein [Bacteroidaceae bacterium]
MKRLTLFILHLAFLAVMAMAQTDVTTQYLSNPSFEADAISTLPADATRGAYTAASVVGWTLSGSYGVSDIMTASATATDNNFGRPGQPSDGKQMYYIRNAWSASTASLLQSVRLPAGTYRLTVDNKCITQSSHTANLVAGSEQTSLPFQSSMPNDWTTAEVLFELQTETTLQVGLSVSFGSGSGGSILIDNFRLYYYPDGYTEPADPTEQDVESPTEGVVTGDFVAEQAMMVDLLKMLANFATYLANDYQACAAPNSLGEQCGCFRGESTMASNEAGVRTNADLSMICAFLVKYAKPTGINLPTGISWETLEDLAMKTLVFAYSTHKANRLKVCSGGDYWGSTSGSDHVWESSLWAMSVAYSAFFQWDKLSDSQKGYIYNLLKAECNYELKRTVPTGYAGDTKAEENGWEADVLAAALGLFPNDQLAPQWFDRLRLFAINSYSHTNDASNQTVLDPWYDQKTVADLYQGQNLYDDYTLQNHNLFHTSYQNVVMQELGEAALALKLFQTGLGYEEKWKSNALMHNNQAVMDNVLCWLALTDGELAMPNGNDWSLFLYDQITSYTTQACFLRDPNALMLENLAYKNIKARQQTTTDGSWLLRPDVQARRMGVEAHRVMMTYLMHLALSTADLVPTAWEQFRAARSEARILPCQNVVRAFTRDRFTTFSWSKGLNSYTGYIASNSPDKNKIIVPYRANNTGNFLGWYTVSGQSTNATPVINGIYQLQGDGYTMNGELKTNGNQLDNRFVLYSTPGNAVIYLDHVQGLANGTVTGEYGGLMAISVDELTKPKRTLYYDNGKEDEDFAWKQLDGSALQRFTTNWLNIDNEVGFVSKSDKQMAFGDRSNNNSIMTARLYPSYANNSRSFQNGSVVDCRNITYYSNITAAETQRMETELQVLTDAVPAGWNGAIVPDPDGTNYLLLSHFRGSSTEATLSGIACKLGAPVFEAKTTITASKSTATLLAAENNSVANVLKVFVKGTGLTAQQDPDNDEAAYLTASQSTSVEVHIVTSASVVNGQLSLGAGQTLHVYAENGTLKSETKEWPNAFQPGSDQTGYIVNPSFQGNTTAGWEGTNMTTDYNEVEKWNANFDFHQTITGLPKGLYQLSCQGFYRNGSAENAATLHSNGKETIHARLYATSSAEDVNTPLPSICDEAGKKGPVGISTTVGYIPNTMEQTATYFTAGLYPVSLQVKVNDDGLLTIGVRKTTLVSNDWSIFDNFTLSYMGRDGDETDINADIRLPFAPSGTYTLGGVRVAEHKAQPQGIYIVNGKKVVK